MDKKLKAETLALDIIVNANQAQKEINDLGRDITDTSFKIQELKEQQALLAKEGKKDSDAYRELSKEIRENQKVVKNLKGEQDKLINNLSLEQRTTRQLKQQLTELNRLRDGSVPNSDQHKAYSEQVEVISNRLKELNIGTQLTGRSMESLSGRFKGWVATASATAASFAAITMGIKKAINEYASFDDLLVDVMKTTNLSKDAVKELNEELTEIETRTSQEDLLGLSRIAGKLGYTDISEITEFVKANNQIIVSLNEDLGGNVEETVNKIGKLVDIFKLKDLYSTEDAFLKVGSALNELGMASTANEGYMVEFARRMAGVAPLAKVSIDQILGLGAALDQLGQTEEVSSTALSKLFLKLASEAETYSKYAGMKITDFKNLLENDFMGAFTMVLQGVKNNANGINELAATLGDLGEDGGRVIGVIGSLANNVDVLTSSMNLANTAMADGTSITDEYNLKNESAAAQLEKAQKQVKALWIELGKQLWPIMTTGLSLFQIFIKTLSTIVSFLSENWKVITLLTVAITTYTIAINANTIAQYASAKATGVATVATRLWNAALAANPLGLVIAALTTFTAALYLKTKRISDAANAQKTLNDIMLEGKKTVAGETAIIEQNVTVALDKAKADNVRLAAIKKLREIMPNVLQDYSDEQIMAGKAKKAIEDHTQALIKQAAIRAAQGKLEKLAQQKIEEQDRKDRGFSGATLSERWEAMDSETFFSSNWGKAYSDHIDNNIKTIEDQEMKIAEFVTDLESKLLETVKVKTQDTNNDNNGNGNITGGISSDKDRNKAYKKELEDAEKHFQELLKQKGLFREDLSELDRNQLEELAKYQSEYQSRLDSINTKYGESLKTVTNTAEQELKKRSDAEDKYVKSILIKKQSEGQAEENAYKERLIKAGLFEADRNKLTSDQLNALEILEKEHSENMAKIDSEALAKEIDSRIASNEEIVRNLRIEHQKELTSIETLSQAKETLTKWMTKKEITEYTNLADAKEAIQEQQMLDEEALLKQQLSKLLGLLKKAQETGNFDGLIMADDIFSEEELKILKDRGVQVEELLLKLFGKTKTGEQSKDAEQRKKVDVLGMSVEDWENLFNNVGTTREKIQGVLGVLGAASQLWGQYNAMVAAKENAQLQKDEAANNIKKENLKKRLDDGILSQDEYNKQVEKLDKQMDKKKAIVARNQAKRERNVALMSAIVNTAKAVTSVLPNLILAGIVGAFGGLQIATILNTELPEIPGAETGGNFMDVIRAQDGKKFRAKSDPNKRGFISSPTVLVGEKGKEWVANNDVVENPNIKPLLDVLDTAQRNGTINTMTLSDVIASSLSNRVSGRQVGGSINGSTSSSRSGTDSSNTFEVLLKKNIQTLEALDKRIETMEVSVALLGKNGFIEKMDELNNLKNNGSF